MTGFEASRPIRSHYRCNNMIDTMRLHRLKARKEETECRGQTC